MRNSVLQFRDTTHDGNPVCQFTFYLQRGRIPKLSSYVGLQIVEGLHDGGSDMLVNGHDKGGTAFNNSTGKGRGM